MFCGKWITAREERDNLHLLFEKRFELNAFKNAKIRITADDYYKLYINGRFVCQGPAPGYGFSYNFNEANLAPYLKSGENTISVHCYYQGLNNRVWISGDGIFGILADLYIDGRLALCADSSWQYRIDNTFLGGKPFGYDTAFPENRDMRKGLSAPKRAVEVPCPHSFAKAPFPALEVYEICAEGQKRGGRILYDFRQEYVCMPVIKARSQADGARLILRCAEELNPDGSPRFNLRCGCEYEETCALKKGENLIEQFDYKALRYAELVADSGVEIEEFKILVRRFPFPEKSQELKTDNAQLSAVWRLCKNTVKFGAQEVFVDCPTREKGQYLGDVFIAGFAHFYLTKDSRLLKKALCDYASSLQLCGEFLSVAPCSYRQKIADYALLFAPAVLKYYRLTEDYELLKSLFPACEKINAHFAEYENENGLLQNVESGWNLVDWPENMRDGYQFNTENKKEIGTHSVINAYYAHSLKCEEEIARICGISVKERAEKTARAFNECFFDESCGLYVDCVGSEHSALHSNILPLAFGLCPEEREEKIADYLEKKGMECSVYMAYFYLWALCNSGRKEHALALISGNGKNSWVNMLNEGATTAFEAWGKERKWNTSLFHPWATAPILIINEHFPNLIDK